MFGFCVRHFFESQLVYKLNLHDDPNSVATWATVQFIWQPLKYTNPKLCSMRMHNCTFDNPWQPLMYKDCNLWSMRMQIWQALTTLKVQRLQALEFENATIILPPRPLVYVTRGLLMDSFLPFCLFEHWERLILKDKYVHTFPSLFCLFFVFLEHKTPKDNNFHTLSVFF